MTTWEVIENRPEPGKEICDFCSESPVAWRYPCASFVLPDTSPLVQESVTDWAACAVCGALIEQGAWQKLTQRCFGLLLRKHPHLVWVSESVTRDLTRLQLLFREHRTGAALPIGQQEGGDA